MSPKPTHLFTDLGGVVLTNGWDKPLRLRTAAHFGVDAEEMDDRHHLTYDTYESGKISFDTYLDRVFFHEPRTFGRDAVRDFIFGEARAFPDMIELLTEVKARHGLKVAVVSNEGREVTADRIRRFDLRSFVDFFVVSGFVHLRKPDEDIFRLALDLAQVPPDQTVYLEDRGMFVEVAASLGMQAIWHRDCGSTRQRLAELGLPLQGDT
jgi:putative hydrolase of the HAD superfamily